MHFRRAVQAAALLVAFALPAFAAEHPTGLHFTSPDQLRGIPLASSPYSGAELPAKVDLSPGMPSPGDQGHQQSCVGWAVAYALKSYQENIELGWGLNSPDHVFSPSFIYNQINNGVDGGSQFIDALNLLSNEGVAPMTYMPYRSDDYRSRPSDAARQAAKEYRIDTWRQVNYADTREVKAQLNAGYPVVIGVLVDEGLQNLRRGQIWSAPVGRVGGGHAMLVVGYDDARNAFKVINSWGTAWGDDGYGWIDYNYFRFVVREAYVAKDATNGAPPLVANNDPGVLVQPPTVASGARFVVTAIDHNVIEGGKVGMRFTGTLDVPDNITGQVSVVLHVKSQAAGRMMPVNSIDAGFTTVTGEAATGSVPFDLTGTALHTVWHAFLPYMGLQVNHNARVVLAAVPGLYINNFGVGQGPPIQFFVLISDTPNDQYYFSRNGKVIGPMALAEIGTHVSSGAVRPETWVWKGGMPAWKAARDVPEIAAIMPDVVQTTSGPGKLMLGTWTGDVDGPQGPEDKAALTVSLAADSTLTGTYRYTPQGATAAVDMAITGRWLVEQTAVNRIALTLNFSFDVNGNPTATNSTVVLDILDNNTLRNVEEGSLIRRSG